MPLPMTTTFFCSDISHLVVRDARFHRSNRTVKWTRFRPADPRRDEVAAQFLAGHEGADTLLGEQLDHHAVRRTSIDDVHGLHAAPERAQDGVGLDLHAAFDRATLLQATCEVERAQLR